MPLESSPNDPTTDPRNPSAPAAPTTPTAPSTPSYNVSGNPTDAFVNAFYPSYSVKNGQFVYNGSGTGSMSDPSLAANYINSLWGPYSQGDYGSFFNTLRGTADPTKEAFGSYWPVLNQLGFTRPTHGSGQPSDDKLTTPNGQMYDVIQDVGGPNAAWGWNPVNGSGSLGDILNSPFGAKFNEPFNTPTAFTPPQFHAPTLDDMLQDPSYKWRMQQGQQALEQSAAGRGVLNTGGTLKDILNYGQSAASQEWGNIWNRNLQAYNETYRGALDSNTLNYDRAYSKWLSDYNQDRNWKNDNFQHGFDWATA